jgi:uncharacterized phiE125 gp8 family phage protein
VTSITYTDENGVSQTWAASLYLVDPAGGRIQPAYGQVYPSTRAGILNAVAVRFVAGYGAAATAVPENLRHAMKLLIGHWFLHRESVTPETMTELPHAVEALLEPFRQGLH